MDRFIELLLREPIIAIVLLGWILSAIGGAITKARRQQQRRVPPASPPPTTQTTQTRTPREVTFPPRRHPTTTPPRTQPRPADPDEVAAEMRRILGLEPAPQRPAAARPTPPRRNVAEPERPPEPLRPSSIGGLGTRVESTFGDRVTIRRAPVSGNVGATALGGLGGRAAALRRREPRGTGIVDLRDLRRAIVLKEILDRPLGLRDMP